MLMTPISTPALRLRDGRGWASAGLFASLPSDIHLLIIRGMDSEMLGFLPIMLRRNKLVQGTVSRRVNQEPVKRDHRILRQERGHMLPLHDE
jgi:hypothetical protein